MKKVIGLIIFVSLNYFPLQAQNAGAKINYINTNEDFYVHMKNTVSGEIYANFELTERFRWRASLFMHFFKPTHEIVPVYEDNGNGVIPGELIHHKYRLGMFLLGTDVVIPEFNLKEKAYFFPGIDLGAGIISREFDLNYEAMSNMSAKISYSTYCVRPRLSVDIPISEFGSIALEGAYVWFPDDELGFNFGFTEFGIGFNYLIDDLW